MKKKENNTEQAVLQEQPVDGVNEALVEQPSESPVPAEDKDVEKTEQPSEGVQGIVMNTDITVVIPFFKTKHKEEEVLLAIRSCVKYLQEDIRFVVIGDPIEAGDLPVEQIEYKDTDGSQSDLLEVLKLAIVSESVSDKFILMEPGTYLIDDVNLHHIELCKHLGLLNPNRYTGNDAAMMKETASFLRDNLNIAAYDYNTHCPCVLEKEMLTDMFEELPDILSGKYHVLTVYFCAYAVHPIRLDFHTDGWILPVVSQKPDSKTVERLIADKCFLYLKHFQENVKFLNPFLDTKK